MTSNEIRKSFLRFFNDKSHEIVPSAPMVIKNDPSLMFTNAGMNQFKDIFLGQAAPEKPRVANSQKCLRVSGKHNDLEEVGHDTYHHTMFEMLGNWSFGDYFKKEAIGWAWEFLTDVLNIDPGRLYVTVFGGDDKDGLSLDKEAMDIWKQHVPESSILTGSKKDNFWEMGDTGPCGPCSEIHVDLRSNQEREALDGSELVNSDNPLVIEIWNLVFIQYNRKANGKLEALPNRHVDTGMGFERLCMVVQGKLSNYDTDIFQHLIGKISEFTGIPKNESKETTIAMRVIADHLRAISFAIADGQLPSNVRAGYVIRRILRRAVRYAYTFLKQDQPFIHRLVPELVHIMGDSYPELAAQQGLIEKVMREEEASFLRTLDKGISLLDQIIRKTLDEDQDKISGKIAFELYDTYGFPLDLTELILKENHLGIIPGGFEKEMAKQKSRSKEDAAKEAEDWVILSDQENRETGFVGYETLETPVKITRYRKIRQKGKDLYQLVFDHTPFYAESGGQVGDSGIIENSSEKIHLVNTIKEHNLTVHIAKKLPADPEAEFMARVNRDLRISTANNHTATHLLHNALRKVLGKHVEQKG
ncbi:MAG TPA: alanine--tRNA ligase, partial [Bacteroidales bacterium]|nr:alanine--tRNA ligase [Bacteroidales bacterium]